MELDTFDVSAENKELQPELTQAIYYSSNKKQIRPETIRLEIIKFLFNKIITNNDTKQSLRTTITGEILTKFKMLENAAKQSSIKLDSAKYKDRQITRLQQAINNLISEITQDTTIFTNKTLLTKIAILKALLK